MQLVALHSGAKPSVAYMLLKNVDQLPKILKAGLYNL
jgi:hypothetical protein